MNIEENVSLKKYSNFDIGGEARYFLRVITIDEFKKGLFNWKQINKINHKPSFVLGSGTNILISDNGYDGLVIYNNIQGIKIEGDFLKVGSGVLASELLDYCLKHSLSGFEWAGGLPGTIGGAIRGNAGAFKGEIKDSIIEVKSIDRDTLE
ncbi:MAG TPA: FAD-binding protein, partial [Patescibacteria group bacterium]|nr:FAD-binding protein [Patescibacteria group bacterium]